MTRIQIKPGETVKAADLRAVQWKAWLELYRQQARAERDQQWLAWIEEDIRLIVRFLGKVSCPDDVSDAADRLAARVTGGGEAVKTSIEVKNRKEAMAVQVAMADPEVRAFVLVVGTLKQLPSERAQKRVLAFVADQVDEEGKP